jgi:hypothetical protein
MGVLPDTDAASRLIFSGHMNDFPRDPGRLRLLAAKCRRIAASLSNASDVACLRQLATEYDAAASRMLRTGRRPKDSRESADFAI